MSQRLCVNHPAGYEPERAYIFNVILGEFLGLEFQATAVPGRRDVSITLEGDSSCGTLTCADVLFRTPCEEWLAHSSLPHAPEATFQPAGNLLENGPLLPASLPVIYQDPAMSDTVEPGAISISLDIFGSAFFMLSRYEEAVIRDRDEHQRFSSGNSFAGKAGVLDRPVVNEYLELLWTALSRLWPRLERKQRTHRVSLSHDVDWPLCTAGRPMRKAGRTIAGDIVTRKAPALALRRGVSHLQSLRGCPDADLCNTFDFIMDTNERHGFETAFYFITDHTAGDIDGCYSLNDPWIRNLMTRIHDRGHEIGLHPSYMTFRDLEQTRREFDKLRVVAAVLGIEQQRWGGRQHFLRWECPTTWRIWDDAGLDYDSTLGYGDHAGFRCGVCYDFPVFDLETRTQLSLREHPLIAMEVTLNGYMGLSWDAAAQTILELNDTCLRYSGEFTLLWHNNVLVTGVEKHTYATVVDGLAG